MKISLILPASLRDNEEIEDALANCGGSPRAQLILGGLIDIITRAVAVPDQQRAFDGFATGPVEAETQAPGDITLDLEIEDARVAAESGHFSDMGSAGSEWIWCGDELSADAAVAFSTLCDILETRMPVAGQQDLFDSQISDLSDAA